MRVTSLLLSLFGLTAVDALTTLTTTSTIRDISVKDLQTFLATPTNWPTIVPSAVGVEPFDGGKKKRNNQVNRPLRVGEQVREIFGLPPVLPLSVVWTCRQNKAGTLEFSSPEGLANVAEDVRMAFSIRKDSDAGTTVDLTVEYKAVSPLAILAIPVLTLDNELALKALLPMALSRK
jgi:hypothetical protein